MKKKNGLPAVHPGEVIKQDILPSAGLSVTAAAKALGVSRQMLHDILAERKPLSAVMCLKVSRLFGSTPEFWMRLQAAYDLKKAEQNKKVMKRVARIVACKAGRGSACARFQAPALKMRGEVVVVITR
jgi:addiction module HigA family antidote